MKRAIHIFLQCLIFFMVTINHLNAQDIHFSQFSEAPLLRNPALAGIFSGDVRVQAIYRTQWQSVTVPYQTCSFNAEFKLPVSKDDFLTIGGEILYDRAGSIALTATHVLPTLNFHKSLSEEKNRYISLGFMGGLVQRKLDRSKITTDSQFDGTAYDESLPDGETFARSSYSYFDISTGLSYNSQLGENAEDNYFIGIAYHHFNKAKRLSFYTNGGYEMTPKWVFSGGARIGSTDYTYFTLHADYVKQGPNTEIIGGGLFTWKLDDADNPRYLIHAGGFLRWKDAFIPIAKIEFVPITISVSYDANISELSAASRGRGGFELGLTYQAYSHRNNSSREAIRCPRF